MISGQDIKGALYYNERKVVAGVAECIQANGFLKDASDLTLREKVSRFTTLNERNLRTKTNTLHVSLNFDPTEKPSTEDLNKIASAYMERIGFGSQPYLVYQHHDAAHPHVHIVSTLIQENGKRIPIHNLGRNQSETARKEIEVEFNLVKASTKQNRDAVIQAPDLQKAIYGKSLTKWSISNIVRQVTRNFKYTSLPELNAVLQQFNVVADRGSERSKMFQQNGLVYSLVDQHGKRIGVPVKASAIYGKPTLAFLEKQYKLNDVLRQPYREPLKTKIEQALKNYAVRNRGDFIAALKQHGIEVRFRTNTEGRVYGVTFIDNNMRVVFNGSAIGKAYSASAILQRLELNADKIIATKSDTQHKDAAPSNTKRHSEPPSKDSQDLPGDILPEALREVFTADGFAGTSPEAALRLNKKKRRKKGPRR